MQHSSRTCNPAVYVGLTLGLGGVMLLSPRLALADDAQTVGSTASASAQVVASQVEISDESLSVSSAKDAEAEQGQKTVASTTAVTSNESVQSTDNGSSDEATPTTASESSAAAQNEESTIAAYAAQPAEAAASTSAAAAETAADAADSQADSQKQIPSATGSDIKELPGIGSVESAPDSASYNGDTGTLTVDARGKGDQFLYGSNRVEGNVEISTTAHFRQRSGAAGLMFRLQDTGNKICVNMNGQDGTARLWADGAGSSLSYGTYVANIPLSSDDTYKLDVKVVGNRIIYYVNGVRVADANIKLPERFQAGKLGVLTWESFVDYTDLAVSVPEDTGDVVDPNLPETPVGGLGLPSATNRGDRVSVSSDGKSVQMDGTNAGDVYLITTPSHGGTNQEGQIVAGNISYSADIQFADPSVDGCASLVFHGDGNGINNASSKNMLVTNVNAKTGEVRLFKWEDDVAFNLAPSGHVTPTADGKYHVQVTMVDKHVVVVVNGRVVISTGNYFANNRDQQNSNANYGQNDALLVGQCGLNVWNAKATFSNIKVQDLTDQTEPRLSSLSLTPAASAPDGIDQNFLFQESNYIYIGYVGNATKTVGVTYAVPSGAQVKIYRYPKKDAWNFDDPTEVSDTSALDLSDLGENRFLVLVTNGDATSEYFMRVFRENPDNTYYHEDYRGQYHFSVKNGWGNDPCGLTVTFDQSGKPTYNFYYQFFTDSKWGPMHWKKATSSDLVHWTEGQVTMYPDEYGAMFSGCAVVADHTTAPRYFAEGESGLVALVTANGRAGVDGFQRIIVSVSKDGGKTWTKDEQAGVLLDNGVDAENGAYDANGNLDPAERDPKCFRFDNKWFMIVAGGPVRIFSSDDLLNWKLESVYSVNAKASNGSVQKNPLPEVYTECPDLFPVSAPDGTVKWVLSRGGRMYRLGDFKLVDGKYTFVADTDQNGSPIDYTTNFGEDYYATVCYFTQGSDFGTLGSVKTPDILAQGWMNTWNGGINNNTDDATGNYVFNGTYNLVNHLSLGKNADGEYRLVQTPWKGYEDLRQTPVVQNDDLVVDGVVDLAKYYQNASNFDGRSYEIVARVTPTEGTTRVGFNVRVGDGQKTRVEYDFATHQISIDRRASGILVPDTNAYASIHRQAYVTTNADGSIDLHIYVDRNSVEVFSDADTVAGADLIFPKGIAGGLQAFSEGAPSAFNVAVYPLKSIWDQATSDASTEPTGISTVSGSVTGKAGDSFDLATFVWPSAANQTVDVEVADDSIASAAYDATSGKVVVHLKAAGSTTITLKAGNVTKTVDVKVGQSEVSSNVPLSPVELDSNRSNWTNDNGTLRVSCHGFNAFDMSDEAYALDGLSFQTNVDYKGGIPMVVVGSQTRNPFAGGYALQFKRSENRIRLFDLNGDNTLKESDFAFAGDDFRVSVRVDDGVMHVYVDGKEALSYQLSDSGLGYSVGYVGVGAWDSASTGFHDIALSATPDRAVLQRAIDAASALNDGDYTQDSWDVLQRAVAAGRQLLASKDSSTELVGFSAQDIRDAILALQKSEAKPSGDNTPTDTSGNDGTKGQKPSEGGLVGDNVSQLQQTAGKAGVPGAPGARAVQTASVARVSSGTQSSLPNTGEDGAPGAAIPMALIGGAAILAGSRSRRKAQD